MNENCLFSSHNLTKHVHFLPPAGGRHCFSTVSWVVSVIFQICYKQNDRACINSGSAYTATRATLGKTQNKPHQYGRQISSLLGERALPPYNFVIRTVSSECFSNYIYSILLSFAFSSNGLIILHLVAKERMNWWTGFKGKNITDIFHKLVLWVSFV